MDKFQKGDKVRCINNQNQPKSSSPLEIGQIYTVRYTCNQWGGLGDGWLALEETTIFSPVTNAWSGDQFELVAEALTEVSSEPNARPTGIFGNYRVGTA
jgi:hypothetical protein